MDDSDRDTDARPSDAPISDARPSDAPTVAACQTTVADLDVDANLATVRERVADLPPEVEVAVFPEYALTGFVGDERIGAVALARDGPALARLREAATAADCALLVGFVEETGDAYHNAVAYLDPDGGTTVYRKRHLWANEREVLTPGEDRVTVETPVGTAGLLTCYDLNFVGESAALARPEVDALFVIGAWPDAHHRNWELLVRARALDGVRWVVAAGRTGRKSVPSPGPDRSESDDEPTTYAGRSRVVRPDGRVQAGLDRGERDLVANLDPAVLARCRETIPVHEDARR
ncbi:carbon-nitrogen hydrolase family protein [Halorussus salilacus]|uniref:carbon-nitrogen hydrolase family protein n=1 Tax=Halorussus salilacus TaxID=2953750 RepID=UPI0020A1BFB0|nr:carbon-nitrogen hydrolase family protein [Halorussus salilacus]USZ68401.1 carbon-nitrogen hydrolase family protein [Halorussus salilacus]